jgi:carboxyl-terminal processing protease
MDPLPPTAPDAVVVPVAPVRPATSGRRSPILVVSVALVALLTGATLFMSGYTLGRQSAVEPGTPVSEDEAFRPFWDTYHTITERYAGGPVDREAVVQGAIRGMIGSLGDPYSSYLTSDEYRASLQGINGEFEGIGAEIATEGTDGTPGCATLGPTCRLVIVSPISGSPAEKAGLRPGDRVLAADGVAFDGLTVDAARDKIRGKKGTVVTLTVQRDAGASFPLPITRDIVQQQEVVSRDLAGGTVGYVKLNGFSDRTAIEVADALREHVAAGRQALILDLRGNPGGFVTAARSVASQFLGSGVVFWEQLADGSQTPTEVQAGGAATDPAIRVVCLIDGGSASASEIVAAALQDNGRATLIGQQSFGKGTVQQWQELTGEGGAFRLTVARWLTPSMRWIHGTGLTPDIVVDPQTAVPAGNDAILERAVDVLGGTGATVPSAGLDAAATGRLALRPRFG